MKVWCVMHREGWCACSAQKRPPKASDFTVRTACRHYVALPWGIAKRTPTCADCKKRVREATGEK